VTSPLAESAPPATAAATSPQESVGRHPGAIGVLLLVVGLVVGWATAQFIGVTDPVGAVGARVIDRVPAAVKRWAISLFGTTDKVALQVGILILLGFASLGIGRLAIRRRSWARTAIGVLGLIGLISARGTDGVGAYLPALLGTAASLLALEVLAPARLQKPSSFPRGLDRREFMMRATAVGASTVAIGAAGLAVRAGRNQQLSNAATKIRLPMPESRSPAVTPSASVGRGVEPFLTPNTSFYRIDTALSVPRVDLADWRLAIDGMVDHPVTLNFDQLLDLGVVERVVTLCCVSNEVGGPYIGNARWLGVPLTRVLDLAGVQGGATQLASESVDGWTCGFPTSVATDGRDALVAIGMNGKPLPPEHGFPVRLVVPGLYGYVSATKWLTKLTLTTMEGFDGYWIPNGWAKLAPVKTQSRIDVPRVGSSLARGSQVIAGVAWAQHRGIAKVEVRVDDGPWRPATLATNVTPDAWRQWYISWPATSGDHRIQVRATDSTGATQTSDRAEPAPDGATGWHTVSVTVD